MGQQANTVVVSIDLLSSGLFNSDLVMDLKMKLV